MSKTRLPAEELRQPERRPALTWQRIARRIRVPVGFVVAALFLWVARPGAGTLAASLPLVAAGLWLRAYAAGYVRKNKELTTSGPYAYTRNPLYLGSMLIAAGFGLASGRWPLILLLVALFLAIYLPTITSEEAYLRQHFTDVTLYAARVPRLLPRLRAAPSSQTRGSFSRELYLHHREYNALVGSFALYAALVLRLALQVRR